MTYSNQLIFLKGTRSLYTYILETTERKFGSNNSEYQKKRWKYISLRNSKFNCPHTPILDLWKTTDPRAQLQSY